MRGSRSGPIGEPRSRLPWCGETLIFAANGFRCPLTDVAESLGAEDGSVTDIFLPRWFAHNLPVIHVPLILLTAFLHRRNLRQRRSAKDR